MAETCRQGDLRENFGCKAAKEAIRTVDRKMTALDRFVARNTFIEVDPATWLTKPTETLQLGHVTTLSKQDVAPNRKHRFTFLVTTYGESASDPDPGIEYLPHTSAHPEREGRASVLRGRSASTGVLALPKRIGRDAPRRTTPTLP